MRVAIFMVFILMRRRRWNSRNNSRNLRHYCLTTTFFLARADFVEFLYKKRYEIGDC